MLQVFYIICRNKLKSAIPALPAILHHLNAHPFATLDYLHMSCDGERGVRALTAFLPQCPNLRTLHCESGQNVSKPLDEKMWEAAVRRCMNLEEVIVSGYHWDVPHQRLENVLRRLSEREGIQALNLRRIVAVNRGREEDYTQQVRHLLPALQQ